MSEANGGQPFDSLSDALDYADSVLLDNQKKGGMTIKYVQSSDNKYVQCRLLSDEFTTDVTQWQGIDDEPVAGSNNLVKSGGVSLNLTDNFVSQFQLKIKSRLSGTYVPISLKTGVTYNITNNSDIAITLFFRKDNSSTGQDSVAVTNKVSYTPSDNYNYIYFYSSAHFNDYATIVISSISNKTYEEVLDTCQNTKDETDRNTTLLMVYTDTSSFDYIDHEGTIHNGTGSYHLSPYIPFTNDVSLYKVAYISSVGIGLYNSNRVWIADAQLTDEGINIDVTLLKSNYPDAKYIRFCTRLTNNGYAYVNGTGAYRDIDTLYSKDIETNHFLSLIEVQVRSVNTKADNAINGYIKNIFKYSDVADDGYGMLVNECILSNIGDYIEFDAIINNAGTNFSRLSTASGTKPGIYIYNQQVLAFRAPGTSTTITYTDSSEFRIGKRHIYKLVLDSISDNLRTYKAYLDSIELNITLTNTSDWKFDCVGLVGGSSNGARWYYLKYKTGGVEHLITHFATSLSDAINITDTTIPTTILGVESLTEQVNVLNTSGFLKYKYVENTEEFEFLSRYGNTDKYFSFIVKHQVNTAQTALRNLWRVMGGNLYTYKDGEFNLEYSTIYGSSENEWAALFSEFKGQNNFTGGYHGGELITDTGCFVKFFADGVEITDLSSDFTIPCERFEYIQYSALHEVFEPDGETIMEGQPIFAYHTKHTSFYNAKMDCRNDVKFILNVTRRAYPAGLFSPQRNAGTTALIPFGIVVNLSGSNERKMANYGQYVSKIKYWNTINNCGVDIESEYINGVDENEMAVLGTGVNEASFCVQDNGNGRTDSKYYKISYKIVPITAGEVISTKHSVQFYVKN